MPPLERQRRDWFGGISTGYHLEEGKSLLTGTVRLEALGL